MKIVIIMIVLSFILGACSPSEAQLQTAIAKTETAYTDTPTYTPMATATSTYPPRPTYPPTWTPRPTPVHPTRVPTLTPTHRPTHTPEPNWGSYEAPVPYGTPLGLTLGVTKIFILMVLEVKRGADALQMLNAADSYYYPIPDGTEWIGIKLNVIYAQGPAGTTLELNSRSFHLVSHGQILDMPIIVTPPQPEFDIALLPEGTAEGWLFGQVSIDDLDPLLVAGYVANTNPGFYFSLTP